MLVVISISFNHIFRILFTDVLLTTILSLINIRTICRYLECFPFHSIPWIPCCRKLEWFIEPKSLIVTSWRIISPRLSTISKSESHNHYHQPDARRTPRLHNSARHMLRWYHGLISTKFFYNHFSVFVRVRSTVWRHSNGRNVHCFSFCCSVVTPPPPSSRKTKRMKERKKNWFNR